MTEGKAAVTETGTGGADRKGMAAGGGSSNDFGYVILGIFCVLGFLWWTNRLPWFKKKG